jgi:Ran GTPase-activating protein (RanGAP) involved in mRNA processing and transport
MKKLEEALENISKGAEKVDASSCKLDLESLRRLMAASSAACAKVAMLDLGSCGLDAEASEMISSSLRSNCVLTWLRLSFNKEIGPRGAQALAEMLCMNMVLKALWLSECNVGDEGAGHLAVALRQNRTLEELLLGYNCTTHVGAAAFAAALPFNQTLKLLDLNNNPLGDDGVEVLAKAVPFSGLRELWLRETHFGKCGCAALVEMLKNGSRLQTLGRILSTGRLWRKVSAAMDGCWRKRLSITLSATRPCTF